MARTVSRRWYHVINSFRVKHLCYSESTGEFSRPIGRIFAQSFLKEKKSKKSLSSLDRLWVFGLCLMNVSRSGMMYSNCFVSSLDQREDPDLLYPFAGIDSKILGEFPINLQLTVTCRCSIGEHQQFVPAVLVLFAQFRTADELNQVHVLFQRTL